MILEVDGLTHDYGGERAVDAVSFSVEAGELVALLGPSGCGKTTTVQAIAGHVRPTAGRIRLRGVDVTETPAENRDVGVVFQRSTLFPHLSVADNVAYGLRARGVPRAERTATVEAYLDLVGLGDRRAAAPGALSGGERRRVELARALAPEPDVLVLDEPLSALDRSLRERLRDEIARIQAETGVTTLFVTHDQTEAMALADRLVVMTDGRVERVGDPRTLYASPPTDFLASFLGRSNALSGTVVAADPPTIELGNQHLTLPATTTLDAGTELSCHVRPTALSLRPPDGDELSLQGTASDVRDVGRRYEVTVTLAGENRVVVDHHETPPSTGDRVTVSAAWEALSLFDADSGARIDVHPSPCA